mgnify:CR=1 FL=1
MISMDESLLLHGGFELILVLEMSGMVYEDECHGVMSARSFVNWYNGHPDYTHIGDSFDLTIVGYPVSGL